MLAHSYANATAAADSRLFVAANATDSVGNDHPILWRITPLPLAAGTNTPIPGGTGNFTTLPSAASVSGSSVAFFGTGASGQQGVYAKSAGVLTRIADTATAIPSGSGNFTAFTPPNPITPPSPIISGDIVAFFGAGSGGQEGIYASLSGALTKIANTATAIPGGTGNFVAAPGDPCISGDNVVFIGNGSAGQQGVYVKAPNDPCKLAANLQTAIPSGSGNFSAFSAVSLSGRAAAFLASGGGGQ